MIEIKDRTLPSKLTPEYQYSSWLFLRLLGLTYFFAFLSAAFEYPGLFGSQGILPLPDLIEHASRIPGAKWRFPSVFWLESGDWFIGLCCWGGVCLSLISIFGVLEVMLLPLLWLLYSSIMFAGQTFFFFQWDILLLEAGFLGILLAQPVLLSRPRRGLQYSKVVRAGLLLLLFKLMFLSGYVKLASQDPTWWDLTALHFHFETQPLPLPLAWYAAKLPDWILKSSTFLMFVIELGFPFLLVFGSRMRKIAFTGFVALQILIALSGNYTFFNLLTAALCVLLLPDRFFRFEKSQHPNLERSASVWRTLPARIPALIIGIYFLINGIMFFPGQYIPEVVQQAGRYARSYHLVNHYGLFARMTTTRPEISIEGSLDGKEWQEYVFRFKAGPLKRRPGVIAPFQPRLDWQMWFAALGRCGENLWFQRLLLRLFEGSASVSALFAQNPFSEKPPRYLRTPLYRYQFTDWSEGWLSGEWWKRERRGDYCPPLEWRKGQMVIMRADR